VGSRTPPSPYLETSGWPEERCGGGVREGRAGASRGGGFGMAAPGRGGAAWLAAALLVLLHLVAAIAG
jgi:hypothetical protein